MQELLRTRVWDAHMRVSQFKDFNQRFEFLKSKTASKCDTLQVCEHRRVVITMLQI
jgi:hypothetical protein